MNVQDADGNSALHLAAGPGHETTVRLLLENGANFEARENSGQMAEQVTTNLAVCMLLREVRKQARLNFLQSITGSISHERTKVQRKPKSHTR